VRNSLAVRAYMRALEARTRFLRGVQREFEALWLGLLGPADLAQFDAHFFAVTTEGYEGRNARYMEARWNTSGFFGWEGRAIAEHFPPPPRRVVVTSAGAGREVLALLEAGYDAVGFEPHSELVRSGGRMLAARGHPDRLHASARDAFPVAAPACDAVVVGWGSYTNMAGRAARVAFLRAVHAHLPARGRALVSFISRRAEDPEPARVAVRASVVRRILRRPAPELGDGPSPNFVHRFVLDEAVGEAREAGFEIVFAAAVPYGHMVLEKPV
jgi:hypothetical protein